MINQSCKVNRNSEIQSNHINLVRKQNLTTLPTVLWSLAASFLTISGLRNLTLTNRVFVESVSKQSDDLKRIIERCIRDSSIKYYHDSNTLCPILKSTSFSLPILLQLRSLKVISPEMIKIYQKSIASVSQPLGKDVLLRCESLERNNVYNHLDVKFLEAFDKEVCPKLSFLHVGDVDLAYMNNFFNVNGNKLMKIYADCNSNRSGRFQFNTIISNCLNLTDLSIFMGYLDNKDLLDLASMKHLTILKLSGARSPLNCDNLIPLISSRQMNVLSIEQTLSQNFIDALADNANKLEFLSLAQYSCQRVNHQVSLLKLLENLNNVSLLSLTRCNIRDAELSVIAKNCHKLTNLRLRDNGDISAVGVRELLISLPMLKSLDLCFCDQLRFYISFFSNTFKTCSIHFI